MKLPSMLLEKIAINTKLKSEKHMLVVMDKSAHEENLSQTISTNIKQFQTVVTLLSGYNGIFNIKNYN